MLNLALAANQLPEQFSRAGFTAEKNFIELDNKRLLLEEVLLTNFQDSQGEYAAVVPHHQLESAELELVRQRLSTSGFEINFIGAPQTMSAYTTLLWASDLFSNKPLRVVPGDAIVKRDSQMSIAALFEFENYMVTAKGTEERWGFLEVSRDKKLLRFEPKNPISTTIFTGEFGVSRPSKLVDFASKLLGSNSETRHPHLGEVFMLMASEGKSRLVSAREFTPLASAGDLRSYLS